MATSSSSRSLEDDVATEIMDVLIEYGVLSTPEDGHSRASPTDRLALQCSLFRNMTNTLQFCSGQ